MQRDVRPLILEMEVVKKNNFNMCFLQASQSQNLLSDITYQNRH